MDVKKRTSTADAEKPNSTDVAEPSSTSAPDTLPTESRLIPRQLVVVGRALCSNQTHKCGLTNKIYSPTLLSYQQRLLAGQAGNAQHAEK